MKAFVMKRVGQVAIMEKAIPEPGATDGQGVDSSIEAFGSQQTFEACIKATRPGGTISNTGYHGHGDYLQIPRCRMGSGDG